MGRIKFVRVGNPFIAFLSIAIIALVLWLYVKCNPTPIQFRYNINDDSSGLIIHEYKATNGCSFVKEHNGLILHSDQGWQYQHQSYQQRLKNKGIKQSMSRKGNSMDNGLMENFFGILKTEMFYDQEDNHIFLYY